MDKYTDRLGPVYTYMQGYKVAYMITLLVENWSNSCRDVQAQQLKIANHNFLAHRELALSAWTVNNLTNYLLLG